MTTTETAAPKSNHVPITADMAIEALREVVKGNEDYVYAHGRTEVNGDPVGSNVCLYSKEDGTGSCIVGKVFETLAPEALAYLHEVEKKSVSSTPVDLLFTTEPFDNLFETQHAAGILRAAQSMQDRGMTWGAALVSAESRYAHVKEELDNAEKGA